METLIEHGTGDDAPAIAEIYHHYVVSSHHTFDLEPKPAGWWLEWTMSFAATGRRRLLVAREGGELIGYTASDAYHARSAYAPSVATSVYVAPRRRGEGTGDRLYTALLDLLATEDVHRAYAGIAMPNAASVRLHERHGFARAGYFAEQGRKFGRYWDVAWYERAF